MDIAGGQVLWAFATDPGVWAPIREEYGPYAPCPPVVGDIRTDLDGLEMVITRDWISCLSGERKLYILNFPGTGSPGDMPWPMFQRNAQHTGYYSE